MGKWEIGASVKELVRIADYAREFDILEVNIQNAVNDGVEDIAEKVMPFFDKIYSVHLRYRPSSGGIQLILDSMSFVREFAAVIGITHLNYPTNPEELEKQIRDIGEEADKLGVKIAIENVGDKNERCKGFYPAKDPIGLAGMLEKVGYTNLGLCIDTGHAICNSEKFDSLNWDDELVRKWVKHIHYHDNVVGKDEHWPISYLTSRYLIVNVKKLIRESDHDGVLILEHDDFDEAIDARDYLLSDDYKIIK